MQITLNQQQEQFIAAQLATGNFTHASEVVNAALRLLEKSQAEDQEWIADVGSKIDEAIAASKNTPPVDGKTFINEILEQFKPAN
jgi:antitoxin ParD1/3/4